MAVEGTVAEVPAVAPSSGADPDPKASPSAGVKPAASQPEYKWEDDTRTKGTLADLKKERQARQDLANSITAKEAEVAEWRRKVEALSGLRPQDPKAADTDLVRSKMLELYPELADLSSIKEMKSALEAQQTAGYREHSKSMLSKIYAGISAEYGDLNDRQKKLIDNIYFSSNFNSPEFHARHNDGDPTLVDEFVKEVIENFVEPVKRKAMASEAGRFRPVPGGRDRSSPLKGEKPKAGEDMLRAHFREKTRQG